jgi:hypothetical protein
MDLNSTKRPEIGGVNKSHRDQSLINHESLPITLMSTYSMS